MIVNAQKYIVAKRFQEVPKKKDFVIMKYVPPELRDEHILVKVEWISVDPYLYAYNSIYKPPYNQFGYQIGIVIDSRNKQYPVATRVVSHQGWCDYCIIDPNANSKDFDVLDFGIYKLPDLKGLPTSLGIGAVGIPGATAYFGLLKICKPEEGETVVVTTAAGAVGSIVGQIAKIKGCKVIGFTDSDDKVNWLKNELGFDYAFNCKTEDIGVALKKAAPNGIECFFDNVGGELSYAIMKKMNSYGRVAVCETSSLRDETPSNKFEPNVLQPLLFVNQLKIEGFLASRWRNEWPEAFAELTGWIKSGKLKAKEQVTEGIDNILDVFLGVLKGKNYGQAVVKVS